MDIFGHLTSLMKDSMPFLIASIWNVFNKFCWHDENLQARLCTHILVIHEGEKPYKCSICEYSCKRKDQLQPHISSVHKEKEPYEFTVSHSNFGLNGHVQAVHESMKLFKCPFCSVKYPKQSKLKKHVNKVHGKEKALKGEKKVQNEKRKAIDDKLLDPNASEFASKRGRLEAGPSTVQIGPSGVEAGF